MTNTFPTSGRSVSVRLKTARGRKNSSQRWLMRQLNDPYVQQAKAKGYRSRAAFKIIEIDEKHKIFKAGNTVVDLGAAPGGWSQIALERISTSKLKGRIFAIDLLEMDGIAGVEFFKGDFLDREIQTQFRALIPDGVDVVMSDMAASTTGHSNTDHIRTIALAEAAFSFARDFLKEGGTFIAKVFQGGTDAVLLVQLKASFKTVKHFKPPASRKESPEMYVVAQGFRK
jgi:23S rRNA (uridine2552-2'-O)-methyltransferase